MLSNPIMTGPASEKDRELEEDTVADSKTEHEILKRF